MRRDRSSLSPVEWNGVRGTKANPVEGRHLLYGFLTTEPSGGVAPIHPKAMPVILTSRKNATCGCARHGMQRPLPNTMLRIVASGEREDPPPEKAQSQPSLPS
jgi:putative SOS response-associated peptidase YedK